MKKIKAIIFVVLLLGSIFLPTMSVSAFSKEVYNFDRIWYDPDTGFNKNGVGTLILAVTYTNATASNPNFREIDYCHIEFYQNPFYFGIEFQEESEVLYDDEGNIIYQEPKDGYVYLRKVVVDNYLPNSIKRIASSVNYSTITFQGVKWYRIYVPNFNKLYEWKKFNKPSLNEKWYTWGSNSSILFETKAMFIRQTENSTGHLEFDFTHPTSNLGQKVAINKSYLSSKGITNPIFEWGEKIPWKIISYSENATHYFINPEHFSIVGMHEATSGEQRALIVNTTDDIESKTVTAHAGGNGGNNWGDHYQTFNDGGDNWGEVDSARIHYYTYPQASYILVNATVGITDSSGNWIVNINENKSASSYDISRFRADYDFTDIFLDNQTEYRLRVIIHWSNRGNCKWNGGVNNLYAYGHTDLHATNDYFFILYGYSNGSYVNTTRSVGISAERNIVNGTLLQNFANTTCVKIKVPVSDDVQGISEVLNQTTMNTATNVSSLASLTNNTYYYDSANQFMYIGTENLSTGQLINWSVNCTYGAEFDVEPPTFVVLGLPFEFIGLIKDANGNGIDGYIATTRIMYTNGTDAIEPVEHNCSNGNIFCLISTCSLLPGQYEWELSFYDSGSGVTFKKGGDLSVSVGIYGHYDAVAIFNVYDDSTGLASHSPQFTFYDPNTGMGMNTVLLKLYVSEDTTFTEDDRVYQQDFSTYTGQTLYYKVLDYFNNTIYPDYDGYSSVVITSVNQFIDVPIQMWMFSVKNMNHSIVLFELHNGTRAYQAYLFPYEPFYWYVFNGSYIINITYYNPETDAVVDYHNTTINIDNHTYYWIKGYDLRDIIIEVYAVNSTLGVIVINITTNIDLINSSIDFINQTIWNELTFMNTSVGEVNTRIINIWTSQNSSFGNLENRSMIIFSVYNSNEALGLDRDTLKIYINGTRLIGNIYYANRTDVLNLTIKDYYNSTLYQGNHTVVAPLTFIDLGLTFHSWLFGNKNNIDYMISILKQGGSRWWERGIVPYGEREFIIPSGTYALRIYYNDSGVYTEIYNSTLPPSILVNCSKVYVIEGNDLVEVMSGLSVIRGQLIEVRTELYNAFMSDIEIICRNPPMIYSIYDKEGMAFGNDFYKICPALITIATTRVTTYGNWINSTPMIPSNGTVTNGTVTIIRDVLYLSGSSSITWVNITCADNNTLMQNTSYIPSRVDIYGQNLTINASGDISVMRETKYNQLRKFDWTYYPFSGYGPDPSRAGWHSAGIEFINPMPVPLYEVYGIAGFSNQSNPDGNSVVVRDTANGGVISKRGPDYDVTDAAIHFSLLSIDASSSRAFTIGYYKLSAESYTYDEAITSVPDYDITTYDGLSYNFFATRWTNPYSGTFRGALYIKLNFDIPTEIDTLSMRIYDVTNDHEIVPLLFIPGSEFIRISAEAMGDVLPGSSREFDVYFLMTVYAGVDPKEFHLDTPIWQGITMFILIFFVGLVFIIIGAFLAVSERKERKDRWKFCLSIGIFLVVVINILGAMGL